MTEKMELESISHPNSLYDQCLSTCVKNPIVSMINYDPDCMDVDSDIGFEVQSYEKQYIERVEFKTNQYIPYNITEQLFKLILKRQQEYILYLFTDTSKCCLTRLNLDIEETIYQMQDEELLSLLFFHPLIEINLSGQELAHKTISSLKLCEKSLKILDLSGVSTRQFSVIKHLVNLEKLNLQNTNFGRKLEQVTDVGNLPNLKWLNLAQTEIDDHNLMELIPLGSKLRWLSFYQCLNITDEENVIEVISYFKNLVHLDLSKDSIDQEECTIENLPPPIVTKDIIKQVAKLKDLMSFDISGSIMIKHEDMEPLYRRDKPLSFLGLSKTNLSTHSKLPAKKVTGEANEEQILTSLEVYTKRAKFMSVALRKLFFLASNRNCVQTSRALKLILKAMRTFKHSKSIHIAATASLYHLTREEREEHIVDAGTDPQLRRDVVSALLDTMENLKSVLQLQKNACLTLCNFKIPAEVDFQYYRVAELLLAALRNHKDDYLRRIAIMLFNAVVCQNAGDQKKEIGLKGGIKTILQVIKEKIAANDAGNVMETCWSSLWNITDETPDNCEDFLENNGMKYFVECLNCFPESLELHRNMMGLMGNVGEVKRLRPLLMTEEYITIFVSLLDEATEGLEVSYNSAGLLSHILSDGDEAWNVTCLSRAQCMERIIDVIDSWNINSQRNINYRSFKPILQLLERFESPASQYWATWALANLTRVYPSKYCKLVEEEGGLELLNKLLDSPITIEKIKRLASSIVELHRAQMNHPNNAIS